MDPAIWAWKADRDARATRSFRGEPDLSEEDYTPVSFSADPEEVPAELTRILDEARSAKVFPWDQRKVGLYRTIFPQMANWLPQEEAAQLCFAFDEEMRRLEAA